MWKGLIVIGIIFGEGLFVVKGLDAGLNKLVKDSSGGKLNDLSGKSGNKDNVNPITKLAVAPSAPCTSYKWVSSEWVKIDMAKSSCPPSKMDVLKMCQKEYPKKDITNIASSGQQMCRGDECFESNRVFNIYRCLEAPFQSDALFVPTPCIFDHVHNESICVEPEVWNTTAKKLCNQKNLEMRDSDVLLPCGIGEFSGVEFVCCPSNNRKDELYDFDSDEGSLDEEGDDNGNDDDDYSDEYYSDEEDDEDDDDDNIGRYDRKYGNQGSPLKSAMTTPSTTTTTTTMSPLYKYVHGTNENEHESFHNALKDLEKSHRNRMNKVMRDWEDLENTYQAMRQKGDKNSENFKKSMGDRFQKTVKALEAEGVAEKRQVIAIHQQRVLNDLLKRRAIALNCLKDSLSDVSSETLKLKSQSGRKIRKCLEKLMRILHKDRHHTLAHFKHLLKSSSTGAVGIQQERKYTLQRLENIISAARNALNSVQYSTPTEFSSRITRLMQDYVGSLQGRDDPPGSLLAATKESESLLLSKLQRMVNVILQQKDEADEEYAEENDVPGNKMEPTMSSSSSLASNVGATSSYGIASGADVESLSTISSSSSQPPLPPMPVRNSHMKKTTSSFLKKDEQEIATKAIPIRMETAKPSSLKNNVHVHEQTFTVRREVYHRERRSIFITMGFAGFAAIAALVIGVIVFRRRNSPASQGFLQVNTTSNGANGITTPEEKHVANMQINGYENPTYKYFEQKE